MFRQSPPLVTNLIDSAFRAIQALRLGINSTLLEKLIQKMKIELHDFIDRDKILFHIIKYTIHVGQLLVGIYQCKNAMPLEE
jgi:hypothetical protein